MASSEASGLHSVGEGGWELQLPGPQHLSEGRDQDDHHDGQQHCAHTLN